MNRETKKFSFPKFSGFTTESIIKKHCKAVEAPAGFADPREKVMSIFPMRQFLELSVVFFMLKDIEDTLEGATSLDRRIKLILMEDDPNVSLLLEYRGLLANALTRTMNQGIYDERRQVNWEHIDAAKNILFETDMRPQISIIDLPPLEQTGGLSRFEIGVNRLLDKYDRNRLIDRFD